MHPALNIAIRAVRIAGNLITKHYENLNTIKSDKKNNNNLINNISREIEHLIVKIIRKSYPQHSIINKESGEELVFNRNKEVLWIINPLDSTTNFIKRFPYFSVSIAICIKGRTEVAVIYDPIRNELFTASRGKGAQLNGYRLRCSNISNLNKTILSIGFPFNNQQCISNYFNLISKLFINYLDFRRTFSTILDLAYVAAGRIDGFVGINLKFWDFINSELLVREAGGIITDFNGDHNYLISGNIIVGNSHVVKTILLIIRNELKKY